MSRFGPLTRSSPALLISHCTSSATPVPLVANAITKQRHQAAPRASFGVRLGFWLRQGGRLTKQQESLPPRHHTIKSGGGSPTVRILGLPAA